MINKDDKYTYDQFLGWTAILFLLPLESEFLFCFVLRLKIKSRYISHFKGVQNRSLYLIYLQNTLESSTFILFWVISELYMH